jgi:MFS family permease
VTYAFVGGLSISQTTFIAPLVTKCTRSFGTTPTLCIGVVLETAGLVAASFATRTWQLFLSQGLCFGWGCSFLYVGAIPIIPQWFSKRRTFANAIAAAGSGLGGLVWSLGTDSMIQHIGLSWAFRITAICVFVVNGICAALMKDRNDMAKPNQKAFDLSLLRRVEFLLLIGWAFLSTFGYTVVLFSLPNNAISIGLTAHQGAVTGALANLGMAVGRTIVGYLSDSLGRVNVAVGATFLCGIFCFCIWTSASTYGQLLAFAVLGGTVCGTYWAVRPRSFNSCHLRMLRVVAADYRSLAGRCDGIAGSAGSLVHRMGVDCRTNSMWVPAIHSQK